MKSGEITIDPIEVIETSRCSGIGVVRYSSEEQILQFISSLRKVASYSQRNALSVAEELYGYMRQYKEHPEIAAYVFRDLLEKQQGLIITRWQDIAQREATCQEILNSAMRIRKSLLPVIITVSTISMYTFPSSLRGTTFTIE